ncbi:MAG: ECF-type sigma factor [Acidobacteria bacterium]|nr:ECF-type sigma factor [Acidobacteriota bacterium]
MTGDADLTLLLEDWARGDESALDRLTPLIYPQLHALARSQLRRNYRPSTWQTTAVVNDLFLKLLSSRPPRLQSRKHFFVLAARIIRLALIDHYRQVKSEKRGRLGRVPLHDDLTWVDAVSEDVLDLDRALNELEELDQQQAELFSMRFLLGCSAEETAELAGLSKATVDRKVKLARAWLYLRLHEAKDGRISNTGSAAS